jgi:histone deacetylase 6
MCYIWDNYLQIYSLGDGGGSDEDQPGAKVIIMGVGAARIGIKSLLLGRGKQTRQYINGMVEFVTGTLRTIKSADDPGLAPWYREGSRVYISRDHACWDGGETERRVTKGRFGTARRSPQRSINAMMREHAGEVFAWMTERVAEEESASEGGGGEDVEIEDRQ